MRFFIRNHKTFRSLVSDEEAHKQPAFRRDALGGNLGGPADWYDLEAEENATLTLSESVVDEFYAKFGVRERKSGVSENSKIFFCIFSPQKL